MNCPNCKKEMSWKACWHTTGGNVETFECKECQLEITLRQSIGPEKETTGGKP